MSLDSKSESLIVSCLSECQDLLSLIDEYFMKKGFHYFLRALFIDLRQLSYYFSGESSPFIHYRDRLTSDEQDLITKIVSFRNASAHPESSLHWATDYMKISGTIIFKESDAEIQFGSIKLFLLRDIVALYKKLRDVFEQIPELSFLSGNPSWESKGKEVDRVEKSLVQKLSNPDELLRNIKKKFLI